MVRKQVVQREKKHEIILEFQFLSFCVAPMFQMDSIHLSNSLVYLQHLLLINVKLLHILEIDVCLLHANQIILFRVDTLFMVAVMYRWLLSGQIYF